MPEKPGRGPGRTRFFKTRKRCGDRKTQAVTGGAALRPSSRFLGTGDSATPPPSVWTLPPGCWLRAFHRVPGLWTGRLGGWRLRSFTGQEPGRSVLGVWPLTSALGRSHIPAL